jgi:hypothetical protein
MAKDWLSQLQKYDDCVVDDLDPHENVIRTASPSVNFTFGKGHGLPRGYSVLMAGPPKGGKSLLSNAFAGWIHQNDPTAFVVKFDTEGRAKVQATPRELAKIFGIDPKRYVVYQTNNPVDIFDRIETDLNAKCQEGMNLAAIIIDSTNSIQGMGGLEADSVEKQFIGDEARTLGRGFKRILFPIRRNNIALLATCQIRVEMDQLEQKRGNKLKMALPFALQHFGEYFMWVEPNRNKEGKTNLAGQEYKDDNLGDMSKDGGENTGHRIKVTMKDSSCGPKGRVGEFTLNKRKGIVDTWEEVYVLGTKRNVIVQNGSIYTFGDRKWKGKEAVWEDLKKEPSLCDSIVEELFRRDREGTYDGADQAAEDADEE